MLSLAGPRGADALSPRPLPDFAAVPCHSCWQVEDPRFARSVVWREMTRVVTPGTALEEDMLDPRANNYLSAGG